MVTILHNVNSLRDQVHNKSVVHTAHLSGVLAPRILFSITGRYIARFFPARNNRPRERFFLFAIYQTAYTSSVVRNVIPATSICSNPNNASPLKQSSSSSSACHPRKRIFVFFFAHLLGKHVSAPQFCALGTFKRNKFCGQGTFFLKIIYIIQNLFYYIFPKYDKRNYEVDNNAQVIRLFMQ